jgi:UDP-glucose 4-epimerase
VCPSSSSSSLLFFAGGCGYIGSHTLVLLLEQGYNVVVVDNLINSSEVSLDRVCEICQLSSPDERKERLVFRKVDLCDSGALRNVFETSPTFEAAIHFAGLKVSEWFLWINLIISNSLHSSTN